jgi:hypothetical protein
MDQIRQSARFNGEMSAIRQLTRRVRFRVNGLMAIAASPATAERQASSIHELVAALSPKQRARIERSRQRAKERKASGGRERRSYGSKGA